MDGLQSAACLWITISFNQQTVNNTAVILGAEGCQYADALEMAIEHALARFRRSMSLWTVAYLRERRGRRVVSERYNEAATEKSPDRPRRAELFWQIGVQVCL